LVGLDAAMPIFNAGRNKARLKIARQKYEQACLNYRKIVLRSLQEVSSSLETYWRTEEVLEYRLQLVEASEEYVRLARLRYYNGILSYLDLLDAQRQLFNAEMSLSESKRDRLLYLVQLYKVLGGGWEVLSESNN
jgi:outer membrane protein, multidrug efflux system